MLEVAWKTKCSAIIFCNWQSAGLPFVQDRAMFIRRTQTRTRRSRVGGCVKQTTLLNLGSHFDLPKQQ